MSELRRPFPETDKADSSRSITLHSHLDRSVITSNLASKSKPAVRTDRIGQDAGKMTYGLRTIG